MRNFVRLFLLVPLAAAVFGCSPQVKQVTFNVGGIKPGYCKAIVAQPGYFWQPAQRVMPCRTDRGELVFIGQSQSEDLLSELSGPLSTVTDHMAIPITPFP